MFSGTCEYPLDEKGRTLIPICYHEILGSERSDLVRDTDGQILVYPDAQQACMAEDVRLSSAPNGISGREWHMPQKLNRVAHMPNHFTLLAMMILALVSLILSWVTGQTGTVTQHPDSQNSDFIVHSGLDSGSTLIADERGIAVGASDQRRPELRKAELLGGRGVLPAPVDGLINTRNEMYSNASSITAYGQEHLLTGQRSLITEYRQPTAVRWSPVVVSDSGKGTSLRVSSPTPTPTPPPTPTRQHRTVCDGTRGAGSNVHRDADAHPNTRPDANGYPDAGLANGADWRGRDKVYDTYNAKLESVSVVGTEGYLGTRAGVVPYYYSAETNARGNTIHYGLNGDFISARDPLGTVTRLAYDRLHRLLTHTDAEGHVTSQEYDANSNVVTLVDGNTHAATFEYDQLDRLIRAINVEDEPTGYEYDELGNRTALIEADSVVTRYEYDPLYRLPAVILNYRPYMEPGVDVNVRYAYTYDENGNVVRIADPLTHATQFVQDSLDRLEREVNALGHAWQYTYDPVGNLQTRLDANNALTRYSYYADDLLWKTEYPDGTAVTRTYDLNHNLVGTTDSLGTSSWVFDELDRTTSATDALGRRVAYTYDAAGNRTGITYPHGRTAAYRYYQNNWMQTATVLIGVISYRYDGVGKITLTTDPNDTVAEISYDKANQGKTGESSTTTYAYDDNGNRIGIAWPGPQTQGVGYNYNYENLLTQALDYQTNAQGNRVDRAVTAMRYDGLNHRLVKNYDPKTGASGIKRTEYAFDVLDSVAEYSMWNGQNNNTYRGDQGRMIAMQNFPSEQRYTYHHDGLGSISALTKTQGQSVHTYRYAPYGYVYPDKGNWTDPHNGYTFTGQEYDEETSLLHFCARDYDPLRGVWMQQDPYRGLPPKPLTLHWHGHTRRNPVSAASLAHKYEPSTTSRWRVIHNLSDPQYVFLEQERSIEDQLRSVIKHRPGHGASSLVGIPESQIVVLTERLLTAKVLLRTCDIRLSERLWQTQRQGSAT